MAVLSQNKNASFRNLKTFFIRKKTGQTTIREQQSHLQLRSPITLPGYLALLKSVSNNWKRVTITFSGSNGRLVKKDGRQSQEYICLWMSGQDCHLDVLKPWIYKSVDPALSWVQGVKPLLGKQDTLAVRFSWLLILLHFPLKSRRFIK